MNRSTRVFLGLWLIAVMSVAWSAAMPNARMGYSAGEASASGFAWEYLFMAVALGAVFFVAARPWKSTPPVFGPFLAFVIGVIALHFFAKGTIYRGSVQSRLAVVLILAAPMMLVQMGVALRIKQVCAAPANTQRKRARFFTLGTNIALVLWFLALANTWHLIHQPDGYLLHRENIPPPHPVYWRYLVAAFMIGGILFLLTAPWTRRPFLAGAVAALVLAASLIILLTISAMHQPSGHYALLRWSLIAGLFLMLRVGLALEPDTYVDSTAEQRL